MSRRADGMRGYAAQSHRLKIIVRCCLFARAGLWQLRNSQFARIIRNSEVTRALPSCCQLGFLRMPASSANFRPPVFSASKRYNLG